MPPAESPPNQPVNRYRRVAPQLLIAVSAFIFFFGMVYSSTTPNNGRTTAPPYLVDLSGRFQVIPLLTVGDEIPRLTGGFGSYTAGSQSFAMVGKPDGLGVFPQTDGSFLVYANHELSGGVASKLTAGSADIIKGARLSIYKFDADWRVVGGKNLIQTVVDGGITYQLDVATGEYRDQNDQPFNSGHGFMRFCSGFLAADGFVDLQTQPNPVWFTGEEVSPAGRGWAVYPDGTAVPINGLGRYAKEQVYAPSQYRADTGDKTVLIATEDTADGEIYLFVGLQTTADPNGFADGDLYVMRVKDPQGNVYQYETMPEEVPLTVEWVAVPSQIALGSGTDLAAWVNAADRSTNFRRPEDIHEDPQNPGTFYFVTTGHNDAPPGAGQPDNSLGNLFRFTLNSLDPVGNTAITLIMKGSAAHGVSYDNITVDHNGRVLIQEDRTAGGGAIMAAAQRHARVIAYDIAADSAEFLFEANQAAVDPAVAKDYGMWETSGIVELPGVGASSYLLDVQAHSIFDPDFVEGGQLVLLLHHSQIPKPLTVFLPLIKRP